MAVQTAYNERHAFGFAGTVSNMELSNIISKQAQEAINFGEAVKVGTADGTVTPIDGDGDTVLGIVVRTQSTRPETPNTYEPDDDAPILTTGTINVVADGAVSDGDPVYYVHASKKYTNSAGAGAVEVVGGKFDMDGSADDIVRIRLG